MKVLYWQLAIVLTILGAYFASMGFTANPRKRCFSALLVAVVWLLHTHINIYSGRLYVTQVCIITGAFAVTFFMARNAERNTDASTKIQKQHDADNDQMRQHIERLQSQGRVERITDQDHVAHLYAALANAKETVCILSGWVKSYVINQSFGDALNKALERGVSVYIGFGYKSHNETHDDEASKEALRILQSVNDFAIANKHRG